MPELPEVETVRDGLARHVVGARVTGVDVLRVYSVRRHAGGPADFRDRLTGLTLAAAVRRGKYLWLLLDDADGAPADLALLAHLGMSGQLLVPGERHRHLRVRLTLSGVAAPHLDFVDQRTFGYLAVVDTVPTPDGGPGGFGSPSPVLPEGVQHVGRDLLDPALDTAAVVHAVRARRSGIKRILLDQTLTSGVGNIYADEALWRARVHPERPGTSLAPRTVHRVLAAAREVMSDALRVGGTSFDSLYVNVNGESGYFARDLNAYGRAGLPCRRCGTPIRRTEFMNRSSHLCPRCQRLR
ncbi:MAG: bifunctional DNA-formamidopyrimidine glycosylase/DNA-(apurinic or apyrimidinic site) lyase [Cellulomonadaceae bacterium]